MKPIKLCEHKKVKVNNTRDKLPIYQDTRVIDYKIIVYQMFDCIDCGKSWDEKIEYLKSTLKIIH